MGHPLVEAALLGHSAVFQRHEARAAGIENDEKDTQLVALILGIARNLNIPVVAEGVETASQLALLLSIVIIAAAVFVLASVFVMLYTRRITRPLEELTEAAEELDRGNYEPNLSYQRDDEVGRLTQTFLRLAGNMREHISDLNKRAYVDPLTSVRNKGAYNAFVEELQQKLDTDGGNLAFAIGVFDCDDLKLVNDRYGHVKGDAYLKAASRLICRVFQHSPVFRIGGDEFSVFLQGEDYRNREALARAFAEGAERSCAGASSLWEQVHTAMGIAVYDPETDSTVMDVVRRADKIMYENKRKRKK